MSGSDFPHIVRDIGEAGLQLTALGVAAGSSGNISVYVRDLHNLSQEFVERGELALPLSVPELAGGWIVLTATGCRLRDVSSHPEESVVVLRVREGGRAAIRHAALDLRATSEWGSHLALHGEAVGRSRLTYHALVHAQPHHLTYLSHHPGYATSDRLSDRLLRWEPETVVTFPEGIGLVPFQVPGTPAQIRATRERCREYRLLVWQKHGVVARSDSSVSHAADLVEYAEAAARYEVLNLQLGAPAGGLTDAELMDLCREFEVPPPAFLQNRVERAPGGAVRPETERLRA